MTLYVDKSDERGNMEPEPKPQSELKLKSDGDDVDDKVISLRQKLLEECEADERDLLSTKPSFSSTWRRCIWYWVKLGLLIAFLGLLAAVCLKWIAPFVIDKELMPIINWEMKTFSTPTLAVLVFASVALFPTLCLPSTPSFWVAGMRFGYGFGFLLIMPAITVGVSLPYLIGTLLFHKIELWLEKYPKKAAIIRAAGEGNWVRQFKAVTLIRISPFPYILYNYCAVTTNVKYVPYILGTLVGVVPEVLIAIYTGILIQTLADASNQQHGLSVTQILVNVAGILGTVVTTIIITVFAKKQLKLLHKEEELLLQEV